MTAEELARLRLEDRVYFLGEGLKVALKSLLLAAMSKRLTRKDRDAIMEIVFELKHLAEPEEEEGKPVSHERSAVVLAPGRYEAIMRVTEAAKAWRVADRAYYVADADSENRTLGEMWRLSAAAGKAEQALAEAVDALEEVDKR